MARSGAARRQLESGFTHMLECDAVFRVAAFMSEESAVVESHVFSGA